MNWLRQVLSEQGEPSSKRVFGGIGYVASIACIIGLCVKDGGTEVVKDLIQTVLVMASTLLGLASVTNVFNNNKE